MKRTKILDEWKALKETIMFAGATQSDQYSWIARTEEGIYIFTIEIDHEDQENNVWDGKEGIFNKKLKNLSKAKGDHPTSIHHYKELFNAVEEVFIDKSRCYAMLRKGGRYGTTNGSPKAVIEKDMFSITKMSGSIETGFEFTLERTG